MGNAGQAQVEGTRHKQDCSWQEITKRCRLFGLTNRALVYERYIREKETECG